jgi:VanZ family protein
MIIQQGQSLAFELTTQATILKLLCAFVLCGILVAGLWPFHAPKNEVSWLSNRKGLLFGDYGSIVGAGPFRASEPKEESPCSLEIWLQPTKVNSSGTILGLYWPESRVVPFALRQSLGDLVLQRTSRDQSQHSTKTKIYVDHVFSHATPVFVTISSGERGTSIYANGTLARMSPEFRFSSKDLTGQLVVGNSSVTTDTWSGQLKGLAIYNRELTASQVAKNYRSWSESGHPGVSALDGATALYLFNEDAGNAVHNQVDSTTDLVIPERFFVLHEPFLQRPWNEYRPEWNYWKDIAVNIGGFMPLGFLFYAYFARVRRVQHPAAVTVAFGFAVSLTIEVLQAFLPTRNSGMTDLITNSIGTAIGVIVFRNKALQLAFAKADICTGKSTLSRPWDAKLIRHTGKV